MNDIQPYFAPGSVVTLYRDPLLLDKAIGKATLIECLIPHNDERMIYDGVIAEEWRVVYRGMKCNRVVTVRKP